MLQVIDNATLVKQEKELRDKALADRQADIVVLGITSYLRTCDLVDHL